MQRFYKDFESIDRLTRSLDFHRDEVACTHCQKNDQLISHGIIYKQRSMTASEAVGKRVFCSNRSGRSGCGRTFQLYIASQFPSLHYGAAQLFVFITSLLANLTVAEAYQQATGQSEARHAWRWINRLMQRLMDYRCGLKARVATPLFQCASRTRRWQLLLPTLEQLTVESGHCPCSRYQLARQSAFI